MPKVTVVIPVYNGEKYVGDAIESVLNQTYKDWELIVVDDGSTDRTANVVNRYVAKNPRKINYIYQTNQGVSVALNEGILHGKGKYIALMGHDDRWLPKKLEKQVSILEKRRSFGLVCSATYVIDSLGQRNDLWRKPKAYQATYQDLRNKNFIYALTVLIRKTCLDKVGLHDENIRYVQDYDLWLRLGQKYRIYYLDEPLAEYRVHDTNLTKNTYGFFQDYLKIFRKTEVVGDLPVRQRRKLLAKKCYKFGKKLRDQKKYKQSAKAFLWALYYDPIVGRDYWSKEFENKRFTLPLRIANTYWLVILNLVQSLQQGT